MLVAKNIFFDFWPGEIIDLSNLTFLAKKSGANRENTI